MGLERLSHGRCAGGEANAAETFHRGIRGILHDSQPGSGDEVRVRLTGTDRTIYARKALTNAECDHVCILMETGYEIAC